MWDVVWREGEMQKDPDWSGSMTEISPHCIFCVGSTLHVYFYCLFEVPLSKTLSPKLPIGVCVWLVVYR